MYAFVRPPRSARARADAYRAQAMSYAVLHCRPLGLCLETAEKLSAVPDPKCDARPCHPRGFLLALNEADLVGGTIINRP